MTYTVVVPTTRWETNRQDLNDALDQIVAAFQAQVPNVIRKFFSELPETYTGELPLVYLGPLTESIIHDAGLRQTKWNGEIGYVDTSPDNREANTRSNTFADYMREMFTANARVIPPGILQQTGLDEARAEQGALRGFMHTVLRFTYVVQEGRN
jgi:hypothetical protein